jgi:excisionase family DNA binding protein
MDIYDGFMAGCDTGLYDLSMFDTVFNGFRGDSKNQKAGSSPASQDEGLPMTLLNAREAAAYLRVSLSTLHRMEQRGQLRTLRTPGGHRRYTLAMLNHCLACQTCVPDEGLPGDERTQEAERRTLLA